MQSCRGGESNGNAFLRACIQVKCRKRTRTKPETPQYKHVYCKTAALALPTLIELAVVVVDVLRIYPDERRSSRQQA